MVGSILPVVYGNGNRILQTPGQVVISYEMVHDTRVIYTDGRPHVPSTVRQYLGDSRGHWEGNTLVIETTNFTDQTSIGGGNGNGLRHSADMSQHLLLGDSFLEIVGGAMLGDPAPPLGIL